MGLIFGAKVGNQDFVLPDPEGFHVNNFRLKLLLLIEA
jgi:hypothetical protein